MVRGEVRTVTVAWSYDEMYVVLDEEVELLRRKHGYRRVPIIIRAGAFDQPSGVSIGTERDAGQSPTPEPTRWGEVTVSDRSMDLARQLRPYAFRQMQAHRIAEAVAGRQLSMFKWAKDPHKILEVDPSTEWKMTEEVDLTPGETTKIPIPNKLNLVTPLIDSNVMAGVAANLQSNVGGGFLTQMRLGAIPPQTSGSALGKLQAMGGAQEVTLVRTLAGFLRDRAEWRLELRRVFGDAIGKPLGVVRTPARADARSPMHEVTPDLLERSGTEVEVELYMWQPDVTLAQYVTTLRTPSPITGKPLISDETAQRKLKVVADVDREADRINAEARGALPPIRQQLDLAALEQQLDEARESGDHESAADTMIAIAELSFMHDQSVMSGQAAPPPGSPGAGGGQPVPQPAPAPPSPAPALPGNSLPDMGMNVGTEGGRPMGAGGPTQTMTQPTPLTSPTGG
jgi:hypothetical protein